MDGYLLYHGRRDDMLKVKATVCPAEVEIGAPPDGGRRPGAVTNVRGEGDTDQVRALVVSKAPLEDLVDAGAPA